MSKEGGYILLARALDHSNIMNKPPHFREIWLWFIRNAVWKDCIRRGVKLKRGQLMTSYNEIIEALDWYVGKRRNTYKKHHVDHAIRFLKESDSIATTKATGGVKITILKYNEYQRSESYESDSESDYGSDMEQFIPYIRSIKQKYLGIELPKKFPLDQFVKYESVRMNGKKDGRKKWNDKNRRQAIKDFLNLKEFINEIKLDGFTGLNDVLDAAIRTKWRGFGHFTKSMRGIRERQKQAKLRYQKKINDSGRPQPPTFKPEMLR